MEIKAIRVFKKNLALTRPYSIAFKTISDVEAVLVEVELSNADLSDSYLSCANLSKADLTGTFLQDANLNDANLTNVTLNMTHFPNSSLQRAKLINAVAIKNPSRI